MSWLLNWWNFKTPTHYGVANRGIPEGFNALSYKDVDKIEPPGNGGTKTREQWEAQTYRERWLDGYNYRPWTPYTCANALRLRRALCNATGAHTPARDGSWCFGASICGHCNMNYDAWPREIRERVTASINELPADEQQMAAARMSGGGPR